MSVVARVEELVTEFVGKVTALARREATLVLSQTLVEAIEPPRRRRRNHSPPRPAHAPPRPKGAKRSFAELRDLEERLVQYVRQRPGQRIEEIALGLGMVTHELKGPVRHLVRKGQFVTEGVRRGTCYFVA
jgi:hypothetical protein